MARRKSRRSGGFGGGITRGVRPILDKAAKGMGYATLATAGLSLLGQGNLAANPMVRLGAAFMGGGIEGVGAQMLLGGGTGTSSGGQIPLNG